MILHLVSFSGGVCSWAAAKRVAAKYGTKNMILLFADTRMEDEDLYRFLDEAAANVDAPLVKIADGRTPWDVMRDEKYIARSGADLCSRILKRELLDRWFRENCSKRTVTYVGLDWTEAHRLDRLRKRCPERKWGAPMTKRPFMNKTQMLDWLRAEGIQPPRLYEMGFSHNNCGGFCVKAGQAHFALLLKTMPERYRFHEEQEEEMRAIVGDHAMMSETQFGIKTPLTLKALRHRIEMNSEIDEYDWSGCGCAID